MAVFDSSTVFAWGQAVTSTTVSANVLDSSVADQGSSTSTGLWLVVSTRVAATDTGSDATLTITLESATDGALSSGVLVHFSSGPIPFASFAAAGTRLVAFRLPAGPFRRYLGVRFTVANGPLTAGQFDAYLTTDALQANVAMVSGYSVQ